MGQRTIGLGLKKDFLLSIITPIKNAGATIEACANSLVAQECRSFEWVLVDGGSTDDTRQKLGTPVGIDFHFFDLPGSNVYGAINFGCRQARGTHLMILNSDDRLSSPRVVGEMRQTADFHNVLFYGHQYEGRESWKNRLARKLPWPILQMPYPHGTWMVPAGLQTLLGEYDENFSLCADLEMLFRIFKTGRWQSRKETVVKISPGGISETRRDRANRQFMEISMRHGVPRSLAIVAYWLRELQH